MNSLRVRLIAAMLGVGVLAFTAMLSAALWVARGRVAEQMAGQAQSVALSLSVALTAGGEPALQNAESLVEPVFDQSYLKGIEVRDAGGNIISERHAPARLPGGAPQWFIDLLPLAAEPQRSDIMTGWRIAGSVSIEPHPHFAQLQLWTVARTLALWMSATLAIACVFGLAALRWGLRPLRRVERSAVAAAARKFRPIDESRMPRELLPLVSAFNRMLVALSQALDTEARRAERFRDQALVDELTGLPNRRAFRAALEARLDSGVRSGWLALLRVDGLEALNHLYGREAVDELLIEAAAAMRETPHAVLCGRLEGACFAVLVNADEKGASDALDTLLARLTARANAAGAGQAHPWRAGAADCGDDGDAAHWLAAADRALHRWRTDVTGTVALCHSRDSESAGGTLRDRVRELIGGGHIAFAAQPTLWLDAGGTGMTMHVELRAALDAGDRLIRAAEYMAYASEARASAALDSACLMRAMERARARRDGIPTVVNVGVATLTDRDIGRWVDGCRHDARDGMLILEFPESALLGDPDAAEAFAQRLQARGMAIGIKHFGLHANALSLLRRLRPVHVKFSATLSREAQMNPDSGAYVASLAGIASALSITPIAVAVEHVQSLAALHALGFRAAQGEAVAGEDVPLPRRR
jgi:EAL domain-containing protein (putative c-di-GMP-specific phosphodiesterase class I)/GGDEF domain-containing protein